MQNYNAALAYINALTNGNAENEIIDFRSIHDQDKARPAIPFRGTLAECWNSITTYNNQGYGLFANINAMDGNGREIANVSYIRTHAVDLDNLSAQTNYERANQWSPLPGFAVQSSPGKFHIYWTVQPYTGNEYYTLIQRKLRQFFDGDKSVIDPSRVMRVPGTFNTKYSNPQSDKFNGSQPHLVTCWALGGFGQYPTVTTLETALQHVNVIEGVGGRHDLGDPSLSAPSLEWIYYALDQTDPNNLDRGEWISFTSAIKQAMWNHCTETEAFEIWSKWCARYEHNDLGENLKQWNSIRSTEIGWPSVVRRVPSVRAYMNFGGKEFTIPQTQQTVDNAATVPMSDCSGEILTSEEQKTWFKGCYFITAFGKIFGPNGRLMNATQFNGEYGGKQFIINSVGKLTNEAFQAATRSTMWTIPKVDHLRFVPEHPSGEIVEDELGRKGVNTYRPAVIKHKPGEIYPFLRHMELLLPDENDRKILFDYIAHNIKYPGHKIPWAPLIQSEEGAGKGVIKTLMSHAMGGPYVHTPNAKELVESGSKFNAWMRNKLFIVVDEIRVDERRDMIEVLKPMISEAEIEIQGKGDNQEKEDNYSNWIFFSNYKDAIPIRKNGRRFSIFYSAIQSVDDLQQRQMNDDYFNRLYSWLDNDGAEFVTDWFMNYAIDRGALPMRAPVTSSTEEAMRQSRGPIDEAIMNAVEDQLPGFRGGWISTLAVISRLRTVGIKQPTQRTVERILENLGYYYAGRAPRSYFQENPTEKTQLYYYVRNGDVSQYGTWQGYE